MPATPVSRCPLCGGKSRVRISTITEAQGRIPGTFTLYRCRACGLVFVSPRPADAELVQLYDETFYSVSRLRGKKFAENVYELFLNRRRKRIERFVTGGRLLDVGCGDGGFLRFMAARGWAVTGLDFSPTAATLAGTFADARRERLATDIAVLRGRLEDHDLPSEHFDLITLWQVLEHIGEPVPLLRRCTELLRPGGVLVVAVPNIESIQAKLAGKHWWGLDVPRHLLHYSPRVLRRALTMVGLRVRRMNHFSFQYAPYALLHSLLDRFFTRRHFLSDFTKRTVPQDMRGLEYGYNIATMTAMAPLLAPFCLMDSLISSAFARGGFIEAYAAKPLPARTRGPRG